jgi:hypothetical protein
VIAALHERLISARFAMDSHADATLTLNNAKADAVLTYVALVHHMGTVKPVKTI